MTTLVPQPQLESLAFDLLTSSSLDRYVRMVQRAASSSKLSEALAVDDGTVERAVAARIDKLLGAIASASSRLPAEVELMLLLGLLARSGAAVAEPLLRRAALMPNPAARWVAGAARILLSGYAATRTYPLGAFRPRELRVSAADAAVGSRILARSRATFAMRNSEAKNEAA